LRTADPRVTKKQRLKHDPEKHALGLDPMVDYRFSEKIMLGLVRRCFDL
jgi:hypothetical protein